MKRKITHVKLQVNLAILRYIFLVESGVAVCIFYIFLEKNRTVMNGESVRRQEQREVHGVLS